MITDPPLLLVALLMGLCIGSFLNVVIYRLPLGTVAGFTRVALPKVRLRVAVVTDNIPVLSWASLGGRCRQCRAPISAQYPIVELVTGLLFVLVAWLTPVGPLLVSRLILVAILVALFGIDLEHQILPNTITLPGIIVGLMFKLYRAAGMERRAAWSAAGSRHALRHCRCLLRRAA